MTVNHSSACKKSLDGESSRRRLNVPCPSCHTDRGLQEIYSIGSIPVHSCVLLESRNEALSFPRAGLTLGFCEGCGFITNIEFDPRLVDYSVGYEETQGFSETFSVFARALAARWTQRFALQGKHVFEIGCGKGEFLALLCQETGGKGTGFDPAYAPGRIEMSAEQRIEVIRDVFSGSNATQGADFICCRHTLEHIAAPREFLAEIRGYLEAGRDDVPVGFELPDFHRILAERAFWDIYYEHCSYFTLGSLERLFLAAGFEVLDLTKVYANQYLLLEARLRSDGAAAEQAPIAEESLYRLRDEALAFAEDCSRRISGWKSELNEWHSRGQKVALWGSGSKAVGFLTTLGVHEEVECVVDINPHKQTKFMPGCEQEIVAPERLRGIRPDIVIVMNPVYSDEIRKHLGELGVSALIQELG